MIIAAETCLILEEGEYSDKSWSGPFRVLKDMDQAALAQEFRDQWSPAAGNWRDYPSVGEFIAWLSTNKFIEDIDNAWSWYLGIYGFDPIIAPASPTLCGETEERSDEMPERVNG